MDQKQALDVLRKAAHAAAARGSLLFHLDLATELARPLIGEGLALATVLDDDGYGVEGVAEGAPTTVRTSVRFADDGRSILLQTSRPASATVEALAAARRTMEAARLTGAAQEAVIIVPPSGAGEIEAYAIRIADKAQDVVLGVHHRAVLTPNGRRVLKQEALSRTPLVLTGSADVPPASAQVTHFGATPSEMHVYLSLKHSLPLEILAMQSQLRWLVDGESAEIDGAFT